MGVSKRAGRGPGPWGGRGAEIGMRGRKRGKGWGVRGRIKDREAGGEKQKDDTDRVRLQPLHVR